MNRLFFQQIHTGIHLEVMKPMRYPLKGEMLTADIASKLKL